MISSLLEAIPAVNKLPGAGSSPTRHVAPLDFPPPPAAIPEDEDVFVFPATAAQRRFWLLDQLVPGGNPALNMPLALRLRGELSADALERACNEVLRRHEALRTAFHCEGGRLLQVVAPRQTVALPVVDVADFPAEERDGVPAHLLDEEACRPFDLARGPLWRVRLVRLSPREHLLICPVHHIVADGWSNGVFVRELGALYAAFVQGRPSPLPELTIQFPDFAQWQSGLLEAGGFEAQLAYWRQRLAGDLPVLDLPVDHARLSWRGQTAAIRERFLPAPLTAGLKALAAREGATDFMVFLAALAVLLQRYGGGQEDLVVGTSTANRSRLEVENLIGLFVNPLLLRLDLSGAPTGRELLASVRRTVLEAHAHADAPFEKLIEELQPRRLQINFLYQRDFVQADRWLDLEVAPVEAGTGGAVYEWNLLAVEDARGVRLHCEYNAEWFDPATIERVLQDFEGFLAAFADDPDRPIAALPLASIAVKPAAGASVLRAESWRLPDETLAWMRAHAVTDSVGEVDRYAPPTSWHFAVLDAHGQAAPVGAPGELCLLNPAGINVCETGDIACRQADDTFAWVGPSGTECKVNGLRVDRQRIERALCAHPHVRRAVVCWSDDEGSELRLTAYFQSDGAPAALVSPAQLDGFLQDLLPDEWVPADFVLLDEFPLTADGRLDTGKLPSPVRAGRRMSSPENHAIPYLTLHHQIIEIWREVLNVRSVSIRDDFFALGGNSLLAMRMLYRLEQTFGKALLPATLFQRATVEHLADEILQGAEEPGSRDVVHVQENGRETPVFYLHGDISGGGFYCRQLSRGLGEDRPFYALAPVEVKNPLEDRPTVPEMAAAHVAVIRSVRPHGPYIIGGFCLGGIIAYEVACQLEREGESVERLVVIDAGPSDRRLAALRRWVERATRWRGLDGNRQLYLFCRWHYWLARWDRFRQLDARTRWSGVTRRLLRIFNRGATTPEPATEMGEAADTATAWFDPRLDVPLIFLWAVGGYQPRFYSGPTTLLLSSDLLGGAEGGNPTSAWRKLAPNLEVAELRGNHLACITEHVGELAQTLRRRLEARG